MPEVETNHVQFIMQVPSTPATILGIDDQSLSWRQFIQCIVQISL